MIFAFSKNSDKQNITQILAALGILCMFYGFMFSRVVSNIGFLFILIYTIIHIKKIRWLFRDRWMFTFILLAALPLISDIWLEGMQFYSHRGVMKLLLVLFPAFIFCYRPSEILISWVNYGFMVVMTICTCYSLYHYYLDFSHLNEQYSMSKVLPVLAKRDHIRISWAVVISCILGLYEWGKTTKTYIKLLIAVYVIFQIIFLHILGAKTGLISLYFTALILLLSQLKGQKKWWLLIVIPMMGLLPYIAYKTIPSLTQRINFIKYDFDHYSKGEYRDGLSDAVRFYSLKAGSKIISDHPFFGVGFSKLKPEMATWYQANMPEMGPENYFLPSSQYVIYWASGGILGILIIVSHVLMPFFNPTLRRNKWFLAFFLPTILSFVYETHLEGQLPLFVYGFFTAWFWWLAWRNSPSVQMKITD